MNLNLENYKQVLLFLSLIILDTNMFLTYFLFELLKFWSSYTVLHISTSYYTLIQSYGITRKILTFDDITSITISYVIFCKALTKLCRWIWILVNICITAPLVYIGIYVMYKNTVYSTDKIESKNTKYNNVFRVLRIVYVCILQFRWGSCFY